MVTGKQLDNTFYDQNMSWWIGSVPPYYCYNPGGVGNDDLSSDNTWLGTSMDTNAAQGQPTQYTNGVKFALGGIENPGQIAKYKDSAGNTQTITSLGDPTGPYYPDWGVQTTYRIGSQGNRMFFGPYDLALTDSAPADGDIIFITTGSDVIGGSIEGGGDPFSNGDNRSYNLIFYSTGSLNVQTLSVWVGHQNQTGRASVVLNNYDRATRRNWYQKCAVNGFVGIRSQASVSQVVWWPLTYDDTTVEIVVSRNDS